MKLNNMEQKEFTEMFFRMIWKWDIYETQVIRNKMILNKKYPGQLFNKCKKFSDRWRIDLHDALHAILSGGDKRKSEIQRVQESYKKTGRI